MIYFIHTARDEWGTRRLKVLRDTAIAGHPTDKMRISVTDVGVHPSNFGGEGATIILPRDRVPELIAALQQYMEDTQPTKGNK